jgi:hypothetical protein
MAANTAIAGATVFSRLDIGWNPSEESLLGCRFSLSG